MIVTRTKWKVSNILKLLMNNHMDMRETKSTHHKRQTVNFKIHLSLWAYFVKYRYVCKHVIP